VRKAKKERTLCSFYASVEKIYLRSPEHKIARVTFAGTAERKRCTGRFSISFMCGREEEKEWAEICGVRRRFLVSASGQQ
jgi:hypothetical protein